VSECVCVYVIVASELAGTKEAKLIGYKDGNFKVV
jgi:hypothetical protein